MRNLMVLGCVLAFAGAANPAMAGCKGCDKVAKSGEGFCCGKGKIYGVELTSEKLFKAMEGSKVDKAEMKCPGCKKAAETNGKCEHCNVSIANGQAFHSNVSFALAKGTPVSAEKAAACEGCKAAHEENGFCTGCNVGFVASRIFASEDSYKAAKAAFATLVKAVSAATKCDECAVAMVTDGECEHCKVSFKDGKKTEG